MSVQAVSFTDSFDSKKKRSVFESAELTETSRCDPSQMVNVCQASDLEHRKAEATNIRIKYPERVPVIIEKEPGAQVGDLDKKKFLIPSDISVSQLIWIIRKRISLSQEKALFLYIGRTIPIASASIGQVYEENSDEDGFLYISFSGENTFGGRFSSARFTFDQ